MVVEPHHRLEPPDGMPQIRIIQCQAVLLIRAVFLTADAVVLDGRAEVAIGNHRDLVSTSAQLQS